MKGNKIRVEISSSNFPKYDRNPNTGANPLFAEEFNKVKQTIYYGNEYPSKLTFRFVK
ncbi:MAG TPA: CocE/NonD family hydrolase C-terminal non-catalytic domain-containing protein [Ignavibacteria bacterium]|nr:CocE/NonD family hydrolase C-terminal non-catalytic domain-containing protein [Ignavibacteria bacterium]